MSKYDPKPYKSGKTKDRPVRELKSNQLKRLREKNRLKYLRNQIELGYAPQVRKNVTPAIRKLYEDARLDLAVYLPRYGYAQDIIDKGKDEHKADRMRLRNMLPSNAPRKHINILIDQVLIGMLPESLLLHLDEDGVKDYCEDYLLGKEMHREHTIQMIPNRARGRAGGLKGARAKELKKAMSK